MNMGEKDTWDKLQSLSAIIAALLIPVIVAVVGYYIQLALRQQQTQVEMLKLALDILRGEPADENVDLRTWAAEVVDANSSIPLPESVKHTLRAKRLRTAPPQCDDNIDNDGDGLTDWPLDTDCTHLFDNSEHPVYQCDDGIDNDGDGRIDGADPECADRLDNNECS